MFILKINTANIPKSVFDEHTFKGNLMFVC